MKETIDMVTISSKGQIVIPKKIMQMLGLREQDKLLVFSKGENILLKRVKPEIFEKSIRDILMPLREKAEARGLTEEDVEKEIRKINHIVEDREIYVELARIEKNPQNLETCKYNIERLTNDYIFLKKIIDRKINYLRDQGINYKFTGIISIDK